MSTRGTPSTPRPRSATPTEQHPHTPRYVLATAAEAATVRRRLARAGWQIRDGFTTTGLGSDADLTPARIVLAGRVADLDTARLAVRAAARGAGLVAIADPASDTGRTLLADLARIGPVRRSATEPPHRPPPPTDPTDLPLTPQQRALLDRIANGETIAAAAAAEYLSLRTANRRIAQAREALGVRTTREAVLAYLRHRHLGPTS